MATTPTQSFKISDPRYFEGDPYEVAERAVAQLKGIAELLEISIEPAGLMILNAFMERQAAQGQEINALAWYDSPEFRNWERIKERVTDAVHRLNTQQKAAGYNPKKR